MRRSHGRIRRLRGHLDRAHVLSGASPGDPLEGHLRTLCRHLTHCNLATLDCHVQGYSQSVRAARPAHRPRHPATRANSRHPPAPPTMALPLLLLLAAAAALPPAAAQSYAISYPESCLYQSDNTINARSVLLTQDATKRSVRGEVRVRARACFTKLPYLLLLYSSRDPLMHCGPTAWMHAYVRPPAFDACWHHDARLIRPLHLRPAPNAPPPRQHAHSTPSRW